MVHPFHFHCRNTFVTFSITNLVTQSPLLIRFISTGPNQINNFTLDYLVNSCGLSPESALKASKLLVLKSTTNPDSVLSLFRSYGFTPPQIAKAIATRPALLLANSHTNLNPKLAFFYKFGFKGHNLGKFVSTNASFLAASLEKRIIPSITFLRTFLGTDGDVAASLNRVSGWIINDAECVMGPNISILRDRGVPESNISKFLLAKPQSLSPASQNFEKKVMELDKLGFNPSSMNYLYGLHVLFSMKKPLWDAKVDVFRNFGWSEDEVISVFKKQPFIMSTSIKKINLVLDFFMNSHKWTREDVARNPTVMLLSLEKRVKPRCYVLQILLSKHLISKNGVGQALREAEDVFMKKYVDKYHNEIPDLLKEYQSKLGTQGSEDGWKLNKT